MTNMANKEKFDSESITSTTTLTPHSEIKSNTGACPYSPAPEKSEVLKIWPFCK